MWEQFGPEGYAFRNFVLNLRRGCLLSNGMERPLRRQTLQVLRYLLEHPGILVHKNELASEIWHDIAVTDNALVQCIAEIRRALRDDPHEPRYIRTVPKLGYIFLPEVTELSPQRGPAAQSAVQTGSENAPPAPAFEQAAAPAGSIRPAPILPSDSQSVTKTPGRCPFLPPQLIRPSIAAGWLLLLLAAIWGGARLFSHSNGITVGANSTANRPVVAIMYFQNRTGDSNLNWLCEGLADMMIADLGSNQEINVLSRAQLHSLFPAWDNHAAVSPATAQKVSQRANAGTVVLGSFSRTNGRLTLDLVVYGGKSEAIRARERVIVADQQEVVVQAHFLSVRLAGDLGMRTTMMSSLPEVMTSNAYAYRYYSLGVEKVQNFQNADAITLLKKAIELDPEFAMAYARIGYAYAVADLLPGEGKPYLEKALQLSDTLPEKDRFYVEAWDAIARGKYRSAIGILYQLIDTYPGESEAYCELARLLRGEEKNAEALTVLQLGLKSSPNSANLYNLLGMVLMGEYRYGDAVDAERHALALSHDDPNAHDSLGMAYEQSGDYYAALSEFSEALALDPEFEPSIGHLGDTYFQLGRYRDAAREYRHYIQVTGSNTERAMGYSNLVTIYRAGGELREAEAAAEAETRLDPSAVWDQMLIAVARGQQGRVSALERIMLDGRLGRERGSQPNIRIQFFNRGYLAMRRGDRSGAIMNFQIALQHLPPTSGIDPHEDCLANAYLEFGMWREAVAEYARILKLNPNYPLAEYHLAQAHARLGDPRRSQDALTLFLHSWQSADPDLPQVRDARSRVASVEAFRRPPPEHEPSVVGSAGS